MIPFDLIFNDGSIKKYIDESVSQNNWKNTYFENYHKLNNVCKGNVGEKIIKQYMKILKIPFVKRENTGHDLIIDGYKTEIKISLSNKEKENYFSLNHISLKKDWDRLIFIGINYNLQKSKIVFFNKKNFIEHINSNDNIFAYQQGGKSIQNDDYLLIGNFETFFKLNFVHDITDWKKKYEKRGVENWLS